MTNAIIPHTQKIYTVQQIQHVCSRIFKIEQHKFVDDSFPENIENILSLYIDMALTHRAVIDRSHARPRDRRNAALCSLRSEFGVDLRVVMFLDEPGGRLRGRSARSG